MTFALPDFRNFIFDLDGVIWRGQTPIPGAVESVNRLRDAGRRCFYCTNNSALLQRNFGDRLRAIGLQLEDEDIITSSSATALYLQLEIEHGALPQGFSAYVIGGEGIQTALQNIGVHVTPGENDVASCDVVVVGIDRAFSYDKLSRAQRLIFGGARFVATNRDATFPTEDRLTPGAGSLVAAVETASGVVPVSIGKPEPLMLQLCLSGFGLNPQATAMIGDRLDTDIACAHRAGIAGLLVATGVTSLATGQAAMGEERPDAMFADLPELVAACGLA